MGFRPSSRSRLLRSRLIFGDPSGGDGDVAVVFEECPVFGKLGIAFIELASQLEITGFVVIGCCPACGGQLRGGGVEPVMPQRPLPVRFGLQVQAVPWQLDLLRECYECVRDCQLSDAVEWVGGTSVGVHMRLFSPFVRWLRFAFGGLRAEKRRFDVTRDGGSGVLLAWKGPRRWLGMNGLTQTSI